MMSQESGSGESFSFESSEVPGSSEDEQITSALEEYATLRRAGQPPGRDEFLRVTARSPVALAECLDGLELVEDAASHFSPRTARRPLTAGLQAPSQLGEFRLIREIGHGGMGVVFEAEQGSLGRRVALKVLPTAASLDSRRRRRFQVEAQAAALLHHEHIVPVFGTGVDSGVHYYVMQFIEGRPLTDVLCELKNSTSPHGPRPGCSRSAAAGIAGCEDYVTPTSFGPVAGREPATLPVRRQVGRSGSRRARSRPRDRSDSSRHQAVELADRWPRPPLGDRFRSGSTASREPRADAIRVTRWGPCAT